MKLALLLSRGLLKRVWVPDRHLRFDREVVRQRRRLVRDRRRIQCQLKSLLHLYGIRLPVSGYWSRAYVQSLREVKFDHPLMQVNFEHCLLRYELTTVR